MDPVPPAPPSSSPPPPTPSPSTIPSNYAPSPLHLPDNHTLTTNPQAPGTPVSQPTVVTNPQTSLNENLPPNIPNIDDFNGSPTGIPHHKFPFMIITVILLVIVTGFSGSFLFFYFTGNQKKKSLQPQITPPVTIIANQDNPFLEPTKVLENPFASPTASLVNPFDSGETYENPFEEETANTKADTGEYQNPFEELQ